MTFKSQSTAVVLVGLPAVAGREWSYEIVSVHPSVLPSLWCFLGIGSLGFSEFWDGGRNCYQKLCMKEPDFLEKPFLLQKLGKRAKNSFFEFKESFGHWFSLNLFYNENLYYFFVFLHKSYVWEKSCSLDTGQNAHSLSDWRIFVSHPLLQNKWMIQPHFLLADTNSQKWSVNWKFLGWAIWSETVVPNLVCGLYNWLYLKNKQVELTDFLHDGPNSYKLTGNWKFLG